MPYPPEIIEKAFKVFKEGGLVIFPTDTVWGIGCDLNSPLAIKRLYEIKKRPKDKPTAVLVASLLQAERIAEIPEKARPLINRFWPGALTLILPAKKDLPEMILGETKSVGLRWPDFPLLTPIIAKLEKGLVAASANFAGKAAPLRKQLLDQRLIDQADLVLSGEAGGQPPSTVLNLTVQPFKILREGALKIPQAFSP